ncbi:MAG TPA: M1 family metallopeptidase [Parafilimonas sp.]|nr:M1 family metallopeptidase [Parafilimonas sp.]
MMKQLIVCLLMMAGISAIAQSQFYNNPQSSHGNRFEDLGFLLPTPNEYRTASGAPGPKYWQQKANYDIDVTLDEQKNYVYGKETVTYFNQSPDKLDYLWIQLDENIHNPKSDNNTDNTGKITDHLTQSQLLNFDPSKKMDGYGVNLIKVADAAGNNLTYTVVQTMMRIDLATPLAPGQQFVFKIDWNYKINNKSEIGGRGGYENFPEDGNNLYSITQWYPRLAVYSDFKGWQHEQFTGGAEFALTFGDFKVKITTPADHVVAATGECTNLKQMITPAQYNRWTQAHSATEPVEIVTLDEAKTAEATKNTATKTWVFEAKNVRDFAFNSSRKFVWDAMQIDINGKKIMAQSYYPKESYTLWRKYSTKIVAHTLRTYSKHTITYPYPQATSVEAANGMEYPMLAMNYGRTEKDGTYSEGTKYGMIGVTIHEVGHNFFPMIVNSDERQWWWMDEGLNTFCQFLTEQEFDNNYPSTRGPAHLIAKYMRLPKDQLEPIMTKGDAVASVGSNAYAKASTGLNILRETIMGRDLFDFAFKQYAERWAFKHPTPADLFRTLRDASGVDIDWFIRGWFFGTDPVDISLDSVKWFKLADNNTTGFQQQTFRTIGQDRNKQDSSINFDTDKDTTLRDFYYYNRGADAMMRAGDQAMRDTASLDKQNFNSWKDKNFYELTFSNAGGLVMPLIIEWTYKDGSKEVQRVPVTIWRLNEKQLSKVFIKDKEVTAIKLDPYKETADINEDNQNWPSIPMPSKFQLFKAQSGGARGQSTGGNAMQREGQKKNL